MPPDVVWPGTPDEMTEWQNVMLRLMRQTDPECGCKSAQYGVMGMPVQATFTCPTHVAATQDQRWLNGLVMMRRRRFRLMHEEGIEP